MCYKQKVMKCNVLAHYSAHNNFSCAYTQNAPNKHTFLSMHMHVEVP